MSPILVPLSGTERLAFALGADGWFEARLERKQSGNWIPAADVARVSLQTGHVAGATTLLPHVERLLDLMSGSVDRLSVEEKRELLTQFDEIRRGSNGS